MSKTGFLLVGGLVLTTVMYQLLERVPSDALNVALGVLCGIGASIPVTLGLLIALARQRQHNAARVEWNDPEPEPTRFEPTPLPRAIPSNPPQPQIIVLTPQGQFAPQQFPHGIQMPAQFQQPYPFMQEHANAIDAREWRIIGEE